MRIRIKGASFIMMLLGIKEGTEYDVLATLAEDGIDGVIVRLANGQKYAMSDNLYDVIEEGEVDIHMTEEEEITAYMAE